MKLKGAHFNNNEKDSKLSWKTRVAILLLALSIVISVGKCATTNRNDEEKEYQDPSSGISSEEPSQTESSTIVIDVTPTPSATPRPTVKPKPTKKPTPVPTAVPTSVPTLKPTATPVPTAVPTATPTLVPTATPSPKPTATPRPTATPTPVPTPRPTVTPAPTVAPHVHSWSSWYSISDELEERKCSGCGKKETRAHVYETAVDTYISNSDGTHNHKIVKKCVNCGHEVSKETKETCSYGSLSWNDVYEFKNCSNCGYEIIMGVHNLDSGTLDPTTDNVTYRCKNRECGYTKVVPHVHTPGEPHLDFSANSESVCYNSDIECSICGTLMSSIPASHNYTFQGTIKGYDYYICSVCSREKVVKSQTSSVANTLDTEFTLERKKRG